MVTAMEKISHLILLAGLCSLSSCVSQHQYVLVTTPKTWYDAQSYCRENYYDLATIDDAGEMERLLKDVEDKYDGSLWIGLQLETKDMWHWSLADKDFYKEGERNYLVWGNQGSHNCVFFESGSLFTYTCGYKRYPLCFNGKKVGEEQYVVKTTTMTWNNARDYCRKYHTDLASVRNEAESQIIQKVAEDRRVWVGLFKEPWTWSDGTYSSFRYWRPSKQVYTKPGTNMCAAVLKSESGKWGAKSCDEVHPFICKGPVKVKIIKLRIRAQDSVMEQNNPAVEEDLLEQIRQQLGDAIGTENFRLRWNKYPDGRVFVKELRD